MAFNLNKGKARNNQIKILGILNDSGISYGFTEIRERADLCKATLNFWRKHFLANGLIKKVGGKKRQKYSITDRGRDEYHRLIREQKVESFPEGSLLDSLEIKKDVKIKNNTSFCRGLSSFSKILNEEQKEALEKGINEELMPYILAFNKKYNLTSGSYVVAFSPKKK